MPIIQCPPLPTDTEIAAKLTFGPKHPYLKVGDELDALLNDLQLSKAILADEVLFASFWPISVMTILQFRENLGDHQANTAVQTRLDLKYALHLPLDFPGFTPQALCKFRERLLNNREAKIVFQELINRTQETIGNDAHNPKDTDQTLLTICTLTRLENLFTAMSDAVETLAANHPEWLRPMALPYWYIQYRHDASFLLFQRSIQKMEELLQCIGEDSQRLLDFIDAFGDYGIKRLPVIQALRQEWERQFEQQKGALKLLPLSCSLCLESPKTKKENLYARLAKNQEEHANFKQNHV